jgi:DNA polymerase-3 subunit beta
MKITVTQENLNRALNIVSRIASSRTTLPILNNILMRTDNGQLSLTTTNLELFITSSLNAKIIKDGVVTIPANLITEFVNNLPKTNIDLELVDGKLKIKAGNYNSIINTVPPDDFPDLPSSKVNIKFEVDSEIFKIAANQVTIAASSDTTRPVLTGVYLHTFNSNLYMTATDGYRLAERQIMPQKSNISSIIPSTTINEVVRVVNDVDKAIQIQINDEQIIFEVNNIKIISRLIDGNFIDYRQLIPLKTENSAVLDKSEFIQATKIAELFARESAESIIIKTNFKKQILSINSITSEFGENSSEIEGQIMGDSSTTLNAKYLLSALNVIEGDKIKFGFNSKLSPTLVVGEDDNYKHIIMPVKS